MRFTETQKGELYLLSEILLWSLFPVISILTFTGNSPLESAALSTIIAAIFFAIVVTFKKGWHQLKIRSAWKPILASSLIIGVIFYGLVFTGMEFTTAGNTSIIFLMEIFFAMLILGLWGKERITRTDLIGGCLMFFGAVIVLYQGTININRGDFIILIATAVPPVGNYFAQQARKLVSSEFMLFIRSFISGIFLLVLSLLIDQEFNFSLLESSLPLLLINGILILGLSKIFWTEAIHRISITKAMSLNALVPAFTMTFAYFFLEETPTVWQLLGFLPIFLGVQLLSDLFPRKHIPQKNTHVL